MEKTQERGLVGFLLSLASSSFLLACIVLLLGAVLLPALLLGGSVLGVFLSATLALFLVGRLFAPSKISQVIFALLVLAGSVAVIKGTIALLLLLS